MGCSTPNIILLVYSVCATLIYSILGVLLSHCGKSEIGENTNNGVETVADKTEYGLLLIDESQEGSCDCESSMMPSISWTVLEILAALALGIAGIAGAYRGMLSCTASWSARQQRAEAAKIRKTEAVRDKIRNEERVKFEAAGGRPNVHLEYSKGDDAGC